MKIFILLSESPLKVRKIAVYRFLISFLVLELLRSKDFKNYRKNGTKNARSWIKSIKIDKICDVMWWTSDSKQSLIILYLSKYLSKGGFPVMAEITRILAANIPRQFFFVMITAASTRCLVQNFQLICYSQRVNATSQYDSGSSTCSKWPNGRMVAVVKHCWLLVQGRRGCRERWLMTTTG